MINVSLPPELEAFVNEQVRTGRFSDADAVIREGLRLLSAQAAVRESKLEELRIAVDVAIRELDEGKGMPFNEQTIEEILGRGRSGRQEREAKGA
jgi:antitoxin ParD1/3/4